MLQKAAMSCDLTQNLMGWRWIYSLRKWEHSSYDDEFFIHSTQH